MMMNKDRHFWIVTSLLVLLGALGFWYRWHVIHFPLSNYSKTDVWTIEAFTYMNGDSDRGLKTTIATPMLNQPNFDITAEQSFAPGFSDTFIEDHHQRFIIFAKRRASGDQQAYYRFLIQRTTSSAWHGDNWDIAKPLEQLNDIQKQAATILVKQARSKSADSITLAAEVIKILARSKQPEVKALTINSDSLSRAKMAQTILALPKIQANVIQGIAIDQISQYQHPLMLEPWLVVFDGQQWQYIHPDTGIIGLPPNILLWKFAADPLLQVEGGSRESVMITAAHHLTNALSLAMRNQHRDLGWMTFSLYSLPLTTQNVFLMLFSVPCGIIVILILRSFVGMPTFGTFLPVLLAIAFRQTGIIAGISLFSLVICLGLLIRFYLEKLQLLLIPRLGAILSLVILIMAVISVICQRLGLVFGVSIGLFPIVIFTITIERMSLLWEEQSGWHAIKMMGNSLLAAACAYSVMHLSSVQYFFFTFPETILWCIALMLLMGRYRGYRLNEILRFQSLVRDDKGN